MKYIFEQDPGHGWIGVPLAELIELGIDTKISHYSYFDSDKGIVWLEEDSDASKWFRARAVQDGFFSKYLPDYQRWVQKFGDENLEEVTVEHTDIRNLPSFDAGERKADLAAALAEETSGPDLTSGEY